MDDEELYESLLEELRRLQAVFDAATFREMVEHIDDEAQPMEVGDQHVILLGFEDSIDAVWAIPSPRPYMLKRPIPLSPRDRMRSLMDPEPVTTPWLRVGEYRRVGEFTYKRES